MTEVDNDIAEYNKALGRQARVIRKAQGATCAELAERATEAQVKGLNESKIARLERGEIDWGPRYLARMARVLGVSTNELLAGVWQSDQLACPHKSNTVARSTA